MNDVIVGPIMSDSNFHFVFESKIHIRATLNLVSDIGETNFALK